MGVDDTRFGLRRDRGELSDSEVHWTYRSIRVSLQNRSRLRTTDDPGEVRR